MEAAVESGRRVAPVNSQVVWKFVPLFLKLHLRTLIALVRAAAFPSCFALRETLIRHTCLRTFRQPCINTRSKRPAAAVRASYLEPALPVFIVGATPGHLKQISALDSWHVAVPSFVISSHHRHRS